MNRTRRSILAIFVLASLLGGTACSVFPEAESLTIYQLPAPALEPSSAIPLPFSLRIGTPQAGSVLSSPRMIVNPRGNELQAYKGARWSDPVPALLREHLAQAFEQRGVLEAVSTDVNTFSADIHLSTDLRRFQVIYSNSKPTVVIELKASLIDPTSRAIIARRSFIVEHAMTSAQIPGVVDGFKLASDEIASQVINWTAEQLARRAM
jgi:cholesterol transport system auxiliary component